MYVLLTKRAVKIALVTTERFGARSTNQESWTCSGPFTRRATAERAAVAALSTHTCLAAEVCDENALEAIVAGRGSANYYQEQAAKRALLLLKKEDDHGQG